MFVVSYLYFVDQSFYSNFSVSYMPGLRVMDMLNAKVIVNIDSNTAYIYSE